MTRAEQRLFLQERYAFGHGLERLQALDSLHDRLNPFMGQHDTRQGAKLFRHDFIAEGQLLRSSRLTNRNATP
jgi:hypothetical protein